ncbi:methylaspartate mutase [Streptomyces antnestii]|uniref:Methylaspartate mutase n=1 Tax=Streptomyces antnestii TaxID=2494256 RepID=A0A437PFI5_9ACTN|nr:cobalamin-dependent protein [Streptomyces sp. San01]RVU20953.1 methylaspartate mutase [Streptomyces sp. San01]
MALPSPAQGSRPAHTGKQRVLVSSTSSDSHTWNLVFLQLMLEEMGNQVINIGACVPDELLIAECRRHRPDVVVISSVNGHGFLDGKRMIGRLRAEPDLARMPVVIGGKLGTRGSSVFGRHLMDAGFDAVFEDSAGIEPFRSYLELAPHAAELEATA